MWRRYCEAPTRLNPVGSSHQVVHKRKPFALGAVLEQVWKRQKPSILMGESPPNRTPRSVAINAYPLNVHRFTFVPNPDYRMAGIEFI